MNLRPLNFWFWPLGAKFGLGFLIAVVITAVVIGVLIMNSIQSVSERNAESIVFQSGSRVQELLGSMFAASRTSLQSLTLGRERERLLQLLQKSSDGEILNPIERAQVSAALRSEVLNNNPDLFERVELLDTQGTMIVQARAGAPDTLILPEDRSATATYGAALTAGTEGRDYIVAVSLSGQNLVVDVVSLVRSTSGPGAVIRGYLVGRLNPQTALYDRLLSRDNPFGAETYLITSYGMVIRSSGPQAASASEDQRAATRAALGGQRGTTAYVKGSTHGMRYYEAIPGTDLVVLSEAPVASISYQVLNQLIGLLFVIVTGIISLAIILALLANQVVTQPLVRLRRAVQAMGSGDFNIPLPARKRGDEIGALVDSFADMRESVQILVNDLERRVEARARDFNTTQEISRFAATQRDVQFLMDQVVNLINNRFGSIYHAQIFLIDSERRYAVLRASTGDIGKKLLERGHRLAVGSISVVGQAADQGEVVIARDVTSSRIHRRNELLPDTLAEAAIPLRVGNMVIGVLDVQSKAIDAFDDDQVEVLKTMADQIAIAIENARLYQESVEQINLAERGRQMAMVRAWREFSSRARSLQSEVGLRPSDTNLDSLRRTALEQRSPAIGAPTERMTIPFVVPIFLRDQILGTVAWEIPELFFNQDKVLLAQELTNRLAVSLENARLFEESQRAVERERLVNEIAAKLTSQNDIDRIMQTAVREVGQALRSPRVSIRLNADSAEEPVSSGNGHA